MYGSLVLALIAWTLAGCSVAELEKIATEYEQSSSGTASVSASRDTGLSQKVGTELLSVDRIITGGQLGVQGVGGQFQQLLSGAVDEVRLQRPVAVGGVEGLLYIVDAVPKLVYKFDLALNQFSPIQGIAENLTGEPGNIYVAQDRSFYLVDPNGKQVLHFSESGQLMAKFQDLANLSRPMDVAVDEKSGDVYVADGSFSHIIVFNQFGKATHSIGQRGTGPGRFRAITAMTKGGDGLFILDRLELAVQVVTWDGEFRYSFGESELVFPSAIAVDRDFRAYVSDRSDNTIRVYQEGQLLLTFGGGGAAPGRFREVSSMWVHGDQLFVADSLNRRVQVLRINPNAPVPAAG
jgi:DNA-binding beta-propeller fold protein YncE